MSQWDIMELFWNNPSNWYSAEDLSIITGVNKTNVSRKLRNLLKTNRIIKEQIKTTGQPKHIFSLKLSV
ncbi:MAG: hypothetical protein ACOC3Z_00590 [Nanoarchaeota archaeon]